MTTTARKTGRKTPAAKDKRTSQSKAPAARKPLRIRPELLPDTATYGTFADKEYVMIPVADFGEWYEDVTLGAIAEDRLENATEPAVSYEKYMDEKKKAGRRKAGK